MSNPEAPAGPPPSQTLIPFGDLPACARQCGVLFDVNGKCVPPNVPVTKQEDYVNCFCDDDRVAPFKEGKSGVCDNICADAGSDATSDEALGAIQSWYTDFCSGGAVKEPEGGSASKSKSNNGGGDWLSSHWQWVVMLVILVVGIAGIWIGACIWRRHYLRKKERAFALGKNTKNGSSAVTTSWGPGVGPGVGPANGAFMSPAPPAPGAQDEKAKRVSKKWVPTQRT